MSRSLCILLSMALAASAGRVAVNKVGTLDGESQGVDKDDKCTISWLSRPDITISFAVHGRQQCMASFTDHSASKMFGSSLVFTTLEQRQAPKQCGCKVFTENGLQEMTYLAGQCPAANPEIKCWETYMSHSTSTLEVTEGRTSKTVVRHADLMADTTFNYVYTQDGCKGDEACFEFTVPSVNNGRSKSQLELIDAVAADVASGAVKLKVSDADLKAMIDSRAEDKRIAVERAYFDSLTIGKFVTVGDVKSAYEVLLKETFISTSNMIRAAGLDPEATDEEVTYPQFVKFLNPEPCEETMQPLPPSL